MTWLTRDSGIGVNTMMMTARRERRPEDAR